MPDYGDSGGFQGSGGGEAATGGWGGKDGPSSETSINANEKVNAMSVTTPTTFALDPMTATAMFGKQLGAQLAGMDVFRSQKSAETLAARLNIGQLGMMANNIANPVVRALAMGPIAIAINELGKFSARNVVNEIIAGANPVYDSAGNITGATTDERGLIAGYDVNARVPQDGGDNVSGTFVSPSSSMDDSPAPEPTASSGRYATASTRARGPQDSSGSGRRSLFGRKV